MDLKTSPGPIFYTKKQPSLVRSFSQVRSWNALLIQSSRYFACARKDRKRWLKELPSATKKSFYSAKRKKRRGEKGTYVLAGDAHGVFSLAVVCALEAHHVVAPFHVGLERKNARRTPKKVNEQPPDSHARKPV